MSVTVTANGLTISHKGSGGIVRNSTPDVCLTPSGGGPVPVAYQIVSFSRDLVRGTTTVKADGGNMISVKGSAYSRCTGDEPGVNKGVASGTTMHEATWITYSPNVFADGKNISRKTDKMFMNNKNCISGAGGDYEVPLGITDPVMAELCKVFCEAREEWHDCKRSGRSNCDRPSKLAKDKVNQRLGTRGSPLNRAVNSRYPGAIGHAEKTFYGYADRAFDGARKIYDESGLRRALERQVNRAIRNKVVQRGAKLAARAWLKIIPGVNIISGIADGVGIAMDAYEITQMIRQSDLLFDQAVRVQPDFAVQGPDGAVEEIYDFKFDDPETGYLDDWQNEQMQEEAYRNTTGKDPKKVDNQTCECDKSFGRSSPTS